MSHFDKDGTGDLNLEEFEALAQVCSITFLVRLMCGHAVPLKPTHVLRPLPRLLRRMAPSCTPMSLPFVVTCRSSCPLQYHLDTCSHTPGAAPYAIIKQLSV